LNPEAEQYLQRWFGRGRFEVYNASLAFAYSSLGIGSTPTDPALARLMSQKASIPPTGRAKKARKMDSRFGVPGR
jgi:hypothetical protein